MTFSPLSAYAHRGHPSQAYEPGFKKVKCDFASFERSIATSMLGDLVPPKVGDRLYMLDTPQAGACATVIAVKGKLVGFTLDGTICTENGGNRYVELNWDGKHGWTWLAPMKIRTVVEVDFRLRGHVRKVKTRKGSWCFMHSMRDSVRRQRKLEKFSGPASG